MKIIYGPVPSWRFGRSLGVDPTAVGENICPFDCIYCQLGRTKRKTLVRKEYTPLTQMKNELGKLKKDIKNRFDVITFSGTGEPTLNSKIGEMITFAKKFGLPVVVLTSGSLIPKEEVRSALSKADIVSIKLDAPNERIFQKINRPVKGITLAMIIKGIKKFRKEFHGKLCLQMMFVDANKNKAKEMAELAREIKPDEVQIDTPLRPSRVPPLSPAEIEKIEKEFKGMNIISVYRKKRPKVKPYDLKETLLRRPGRI